MKTAQEIISAMRADKRLTASRSRSKLKHRNYSNLYTLCLGERGYHGINKKGYFTKFYSYGTVGHCAIFVEAHLIWAGYPQLVPNKGYIMNTNVFAKWLKSEPTIKGLGQVDWTTDSAKAKKAMAAGKMVIVFKGSKKSKSFDHTCTGIKIVDGYIYTVDGNVGGKYKGKKINNGVVKKRKLKKHRWGFAILPIPVGQEAAAKKKTTSITYVVKGVKTNLNVREKATTKSKVVHKLKNGTVVTVTKIKGKWAYIPKYKGWCSTKYLKKK